MVEKQALAARADKMPAEITLQRFAGSTFSTLVYVPRQDQPESAQSTTAHARRPPYCRESVACRIESIARGLSYNDSPQEGTAKHWLYELAGRVRRGSVTCPVHAATKPLHQHIDEAHAQLDRAGVPREWPNEQGRMAKRYVAARISYLIENMLKVKS